MTPTVWSEELETGVVWQDFQHQELVSRINELHSSIEFKADDMKVQKILKFLDTYVVDHFGIEEIYMKKYTYSAIDAHIKEHETFKKNYHALKESYQDPSDTAAALLCYDLNEWIVNHITKADLVLGKFLKETICCGIGLDV